MYYNNHINTTSSTNYTNHVYTIYIYILFIMMMIINMVFHKHVQITQILANTHANQLNMCKNA